MKHFLLKTEYLIQFAEGGHDILAITMIAVTMMLKIRMKMIIKDDLTIVPFLEYKKSTPGSKNKGENRIQHRIQHRLLPFAAVC